MKLEWDEEKYQLNLEKHQLAFEDASIVFNEDALSFLDNRFDYKEERYATFGQLKGEFVVVVHTKRGEAHRIISMRRINKREKKFYQEQLKKVSSNERRGHRLF